MDEKKVREAVEELKSLLYIRKRTIEALPDSARKDSLYNNEITALETAIEALEKQLPKKPKQADEQRIRYCTTHVCPGCGEEFTGMVSGYCYHCGQRIEYDD